MISLVTLFGSLALAGGGVGYFIFPMGLSTGIKSLINLKEGGMVYPVYMEPPFTTTTEFRLYAITNPR